MDKLLLVDGSNLLFQMFYGMPARIVNSRGQAVQGALGFIGALLKILRMVEPTHVAVVFDGECANPRKEMDAAYKANRPDYSAMAMEDTPFSQLPFVFAALETLGIPFAETEDCEADDWIAGYARAVSDWMPVVIASQDSDFFQLIGPRVTVLRYRGRATTLCGPDYVRRRFGIGPEQYADFKAMVGDPADNIRGARFIGIKTAAALLQRFGDLEGIIAGSEQAGRPSVCRSIAENAHLLRHNRLLIRLEGARELPFAPDEMRCRVPEMSTMEVLRAIGAW